MTTREKIRVIRRLKDLSQKFVAHNLGISRKDYCKFEQEISKPVSQEKLEKFSMILEMTTQEILDFKFEQSTDAAQKLDRLESEMCALKSLLFQMWDYLRSLNGNESRGRERERERERETRKAEFR